MRDRTVDIIITRQLDCHCEVSLNELQDFITNLVTAQRLWMKLSSGDSLLLDEGKLPHRQRI